MKRLIITICVVLIAAAGMAGAGCDRTGEIQFSDAVDTTAGADAASDVADTSGVTAMAAGGGGDCDPIYITKYVYEDKKEGEEGEEGKTCLASFAPVGASYISVLNDAQKAVVAFVDAFPPGLSQAGEQIKQSLSRPFNEFGLEEIVFFASFSHSLAVDKHPSKECTDKWVSWNGGVCHSNTMTHCSSDMDCAWDKTVNDVGNFPGCSNFIDTNADYCKMDQPEPEKPGILVSWDLEQGGPQKFEELKTMLDELNDIILINAQENWDNRCIDANDQIICDTTIDPRPEALADLDPSKVMELEQISDTEALIHPMGARPPITEGGGSCKFVRFDTIQTRPAVYMVLKDLKTLIRRRPNDPIIIDDQAVANNQLIAGIDLVDKHYYLSAAVVSKETDEVATHLSFVDNLDSNFGLGVWKLFVGGVVKAMK